MSKKHQLKTEDVRKMTDEELGIEIDAQRGKLFTARSQSVTEKVEDFSQFGDYKRNIARLLTEQTARRIKTAPARSAKAPARPAAPSKAKAAPARRPAPRKSAAKAATK